jgi:hypothetical protein
VNSIMNEAAVACFKVNSICLFYDNIPTAEVIWSSTKCQIMNGVQGEILNDVEIVSK